MIGIILSHDIFDEPYNQTAVKKGCDRFNGVCKRLNEHVFTRYSDKTRGGLVGKDMTDEYVTVHYSGELSDTDKAEIADCIKEMHTLKKSKYGNGDLPEMVIIFCKVQSSDFFCYNIK